MTQWTRFKNRQDQLVNEDMGYSQNVVIATPTETYTPGDGYTLSHTDQGTYDVALMTPQDATEQTEYGTLVDSDLIAEVPVSVVESLSDGLDGYGESGEGVARFKPTDTSKVYNVETVQEPRNGIIAVGLVEV